MKIKCLNHCKLQFKRFLKQMLPVDIYNYLISLYVNIGQSKYTLKGFLFRYQNILFQKPPGFLYPEVLFIFLTTRCNLRCFICRREDFKGADLEFENIYKLEPAIKNAAVIDLTGWGEPFLYPKIREVIQYISQVNSKQRIFQITTNGSLLTKELGRLLKGRLHFLKISLNAACKDTYNRDMVYGDFDKTMESIRDFMSELDLEDRNNIRLHLVAHTENYREIPEFIDLAKQLEINKVDIGQYMAGIAEHEGCTLLNVKDDYNKVITLSETKCNEAGITFYAPRFFDSKPSLSQKCLEPLKVCLVGVDGEVSPCCFAGTYSIGNVYESGFEAVWFGREYQKLRNKRYLKACQQCAPYVSLDNPAAHYDPHYKAKLDLK